MIIIARSMGNDNKKWVLIGWKVVCWKWWNRMLKIGKVFDTKQENENNKLVEKVLNGVENYF